MNPSTANMKLVENGYTFYTDPHFWTGIAVVVGFVASIWLFFSAYQWLRDTWQNPRTSGLVLVLIAVPYFIFFLIVGSVYLASLGQARDWLNKD